MPDDPPIPCEVVAVAPPPNGTTNGWKQNTNLIMADGIGTYHFFIKSRMEIFCNQGSPGGCMPCFEAYLYVKDTNGQYNQVSTPTVMPDGVNNLFEGECGQINTFEYYWDVIIQPTGYYQFVVKYGQPGPDGCETLATQVIEFDAADQLAYQAQYNEPPWPPIYSHCI